MFLLQVNKMLMKIHRHHLCKRGQWQPGQSSHLFDVKREMIERHKAVFMERAFATQDDDDGGDAEGFHLCRPQRELDLIAQVVMNWQTDVCLKEMEPGPKKDWLTKFWRKYNLGSKWVALFHAEEIQAPGSPPCIIVRRIENKGQGKKTKKVPGRIVVSRKQVFNAIDEWHCGNGHVGKESTSTYYQEQYFNCTQRLVRIYCATCFTCMWKNPITKPARGRRKPILSKTFCDRFQLDLIDFHKLRKCDPFGVLMRWVLAIKDHCTGLVYLCALPCKRPKLVAYKFQEIFGFIGYPKIIHTDNGKEFTRKLTLQFLHDLNPNNLTVTGRP